jgi:hypothetical protein
MPDGRTGVVRCIQHQNVDFPAEVSVLRSVDGGDSVWDCDVGGDADDFGGAVRRLCVEGLDGLVERVEVVGRLGGGVGS